MTTETTVFAVDLATLAREIAMDIYPTADVLKIHQLGDEEWSVIQANPKFQDMLASIQRDWLSAGNTRERVRVKAATGLETMLEQYIAEIADTTIPLTQRVEAGKFLARLGELEANTHAGGAAGGGVIININTGRDRPTITLQANPVLEQIDD